MSDKLTATSGGDPSAKTISVPVFHLYHKLLPGAGCAASGCLEDKVPLLQSKDEGALCICLILQVNLFPWR